jgi:hypothetical protein
MIYEKKSENDIYEVEAKEVASIHGHGEAKRRICKGIKWRVSGSEDLNEGILPDMMVQSVYYPSL